MPVPSTIDDLSTTASSNSPAGTDSPQDGDNYIRSLSSFIAQLRDKLDGDAGSVTLVAPTFEGTAVAEHVLASGLVTAEDLLVNSTATVTAMNVLADLAVDDDAVIAGDLTVTGNITNSGNVTAGSSSADTFTVNATPDGQIDFGTYTPSASNTTNCTATPGRSFWLRIGDICGWLGSVTIDPTSASVATGFRMTTPINSNFVANDDGLGIARRDTGGSIPDHGSIISTSAGTGSVVFFQYTNDTDTAARSWIYIVFFKII